MALSIALCTLESTGCGECRNDSPGGCQDFFSVGFDKQSTWAFGDYVVELIIDGKRVICTMPVLAPDASMVEVCDDEQSRVYYSNREPSYVTMFGVFGDVAVTVTFEADELGSASFEPAYEKYDEQPRRCGPTCVRASEDLVLE